MDRSYAAGARRETVATAVTQTIVMTGRVDLQRMSVTRSFLDTGGMQKRVGAVGSLEGTAQPLPLESEVTRMKQPYRQSDSDSG